MFKKRFKANDLGVRNGRVNEAFWWVLYSGILLSIIGFIGMEETQQWFNAHSMESPKNDVNKT